MVGYFGKNKIVGILAVVAVVIIAAYFFIGSQAADDPIARYKAAMAKDMMGGTTPQETLDMFVAALRTGDVEKAAGYFMFDDNLSRAKWVTGLAGLKEKGLLGKMADDIEQNARPGTPAYEGDYGFVLYNKDGGIGAEIDMEFNAQSGVWKLQGL